MIPTAEDFEMKLRQIFRDAQDNGESSVAVVSGDLHREIGGYPGQNHRMPICCNVMKRLIREGDEVLSEPLRGQGATLRVKYRLPR